jgi:phospholipase A2
MDIIRETSADQSGTLVLEIILHKGRNLTKTWIEKAKSLLMDNVMDPYIRFEVTHPSPLAETPVQKSSSKDNEENPDWEEELSFLVDEHEPGQLQITLWDANYVFDSQMSEPVFIDLDQLPIGDGNYQRRTMQIHTTGEIEVSFRMSRFTEDVDTAINCTKQSKFDKEMYPHSHIQRVDVIIYAGYDLKKSLYQKICQLGTDLLMDPYVQVKVTKPWEKAADAATQNTRFKKNTENPVWNEELSFLIDTRGGPGKLQLTIWDSNLLMDMKLTDAVEVDLSEIIEGSQYEKKQLKVYGGGVLEISLRRRIPTADVRYGEQVHETEQEIVAKRRKKASKAIMALLQEDTKAKKIPTVSIVASGGGMRAMIGISGSVRALRDAGLLDCCTYMSTLSGSTWYLSQLYLLDEGMDIDKCNEQLCERCSVMAPLMDVARIPDHIGVIKEKYNDGHEISLVDIWSAMIGDVFKPVLHKQGRALLSDAKDRVATAQLPFPIYTAVYVQEETATETFAEWVEFTPFEYGIRNFKLFTSIKDISSDRHCGIVSRRCEEFNLNYLQGLWGSAFAGEIHVWVKTLLGCEEESMTGSFFHKILGWTGLDDWRPLAAKLPNYMEGVSTCPQMKRRICCNLKHAFKDCPHPCDGVDGQKTGVFIDPVKKKKLHTDEEKVHRAGRVPDATKELAQKIHCDVRQAKSLTVVDAGLDFNLPFPPLLRPERPTDVFLVFDFSWLGSQENDPFGELRNAKQWADDNGYKFPTIPDDIFDKNQPKEYYIVEDHDDPDCPTVVFFSLCNVSRRFVDISGQDESFAKVDPFGPVYSTFNFNYTAEDFHRLHGLCYYNATLAVEDIKEAIARKLK